MPARPLIQAQSLLRGGRAYKVHLPARSAIAPVSVPIPLRRASPHCRGYHVSSKVLASSASNGTNDTSSNSGASQNASTPGWSSGSVLAVAAAAAISGWGLSSFVPFLSRDTKGKSKNKGHSIQDDGDTKDEEIKNDRRKEHAVQAHNDDGEVGFANRSEMQEAS
jgi:D-lactate dehydrogenase (cytochrome)